MIKRITKLVTSEGEYLICKLTEGCNKGYIGLNVEWVTDGKLNRELNGVQMHLNDTIEKVIDEIKMSDEIERLMRENNIEIMEAMKIYLENH
jgi:hypothetical protein